VTARVTWSVRPKAARDAAAVVALLADVAREGRWLAIEWPFDITARSEAMRTAILDRRIVGWCAVDGSAIVGDLTVHRIEHPEPEIGMVVAATHRGRGIGRALIENALAWAAASGREALRLAVFPDNAAALALYRAAGFVEIERQPGAVARNVGAPLDVLVMRRAVAGPL
jgi:[ribosomal protein S18]-alanine N-acetyltransferase